MLKITDLKEYHKNPRKISEDRFNHLAQSLAKLGDLGGVVVNAKTKEIIGGNQRTKTFLAEKDRYEIQITDRLTQKEADGTIARGYVIKDKGQPTEQRFSYREVDWTDDQMEEANIVANKITGMWDFDMLANKFDVDKLMAFGFSQMDLDLLPKPPEVKMDNEGLTKSLDTYLEGNIKQIVLFFKAEDFDAAVGRLDKVMAFYGVESHTEAVIKMLDEWDQTHHEDLKAQKEAAGS